MTAATDLFSSAERDFIRREFCRHFSTDPALADGILLRTWRSGPKAGQPKIPKPMTGLLERGLVALDPNAKPSFVAYAYFTEAGLAAMRELLADRRLMDPERFAHLRRELGLDLAAPAQDQAAPLSCPSPPADG